MSAPSLKFTGIKAIVFDLDGTLYQNETMGEEVTRSACRYVSEITGTSVAEAEALIEQQRRRFTESGGTLSRAVEALGGNLKDLHESLSEGVHPEGVLSVDPRVPAFLKRLAQRFELVIYTNNNRTLSSRIMREIGVSGLFRRIYTIEDFWRPKPDREAILTILEQIGCPPFQALFVGDRPDVDLKVPAELGCRMYEATTLEELLALEGMLE